MTFIKVTYQDSAQNYINSEAILLITTITEPDKVKSKLPADIQTELTLVGDRYVRIKETAEEIIGQLTAEPFFNPYLPKDYPERIKKYMEDRASTKE